MGSRQHAKEMSLSINQLCVLCAFARDVDSLRGRHIPFGCRLRADPDPAGLFFSQGAVQHVGHGALQARQRWAPLNRGSPHEGQWYRSHWARAHSTLPFFVPILGDLSRQRGMTCSITLRPVAKPNFRIISQGQSLHWCRNRNPCFDAAADLADTAGGIHGLGRPSSCSCMHPRHAVPRLVP